jgi:uncharacterized protein YraI
MNRRTRKMLLNLATGVAVAATAAVVFLPAAQAAPGVVTTNVNVRSGPGTNYPVVDLARSGTPVDVQQCQGSWCYISKPGPDGWISSSFLSAGGRPVNPAQPGVNFGFSVGGPGGPQVNIGVGNQTPPRPPVGYPRPPRPPVYEEPEEFGEVCFFDRTRFRGDSTCLGSGDSVSNLRGWADRISSIDNPDGLRVEVCSEVGFLNCRTYATSASSLGDFDDYIVSVRVR